MSISETEENGTVIFEGYRRDRLCRLKVGATSSGSWPVVDFGIISVEPSDFATTKLVNSVGKVTD